MAKTLARYIESWRLRNGLTQQELGELCGVSGGTISHIETGKGTRTGTLEKIARGTKIPLRQLQDALDNRNGVSTPVESTDVTDILLQFWDKLTPEGKKRLLEQAMELAIGLDIRN